MCVLKFSKGHSSVNSVGGVMLLVLSTSSESYFIFAPSFVKASHRVSELRT